MAWTLYRTVSGRSGDRLIELGTTTDKGDSWGQNSAIQVVGDEVLFPFSAPPPGLYVGVRTELSPSNAAIVVASGRFRAPQPLGVRVPLLTQQSVSFPVGLVLETDRTVSVQGADGTSYGQTQTALGAAAVQLTLVVDQLSSPPSVHVFVNLQEEVRAGLAGPFWAAGGDLRLYWGESARGASAAGDVYGQDLTLRQSTDVADSPRTVPLPVLRCAGGAGLRPTAEGSVAQWDNGTTPPPNTWQDVDDLPNDGDTSRIAETQVGLLHLFQTAAANPVPAGATVYAVQLGHVGRILADGKGYANIVLSRAGVLAESPVKQAAGSYRGYTQLFTTRPNGAPWERTDLNPGVLHFGSRALEIIPDRGTFPGITAVTGPIAIYSTENLPLATLPPPGRRRIMST